MYISKHKDNETTILNAMWTTSLTCADVAGFVKTLPVGVHLARRPGCLRSLMTCTHSSLAPFEDAVILGN